jgi:hypothetical protein
MTDDSQQLAGSDVSSNDISTLASNETNEIEDTVIRLETDSNWSMSMQIRLEGLHRGTVKRWPSKKLRHNAPNPFFEVSVLFDESSATG